MEVTNFGMLQSLLRVQSFS